MAKKNIKNRPIQSSGGTIMEPNAPRRLPRSLFLIEYLSTTTFYPNVSTKLRSGLFCYRKSVCLSFVCNVCAPYSGGWTFR